MVQPQGERIIDHLHLQSLDVWRPGKGCAIGFRTGVQAWQQGKAEEGAKSSQGKCDEWE